MSNIPDIEAIEACLPQTQCGLCGYGGCKPYAKALLEKKASIDLCPPGGLQTLQQLGALLAIDPSPYEAQVVPHAKQTAVIREEACIGCMKCIQACPVDAIIGAQSQMHTVLTAECTGCELCIAPCPMDCIDLNPHPRTNEPDWDTHRRAQSKKRFAHKQMRAQEKQETKNIIHEIRAPQSHKTDFLDAMLERAKAKGKSLD